MPGDRFIVRMFSPVVTIGGGVALDVHSPTKIKRAEALARLAKLESATIAERIALFVKESPHGLSMDDLVARTGLTPATLVPPPDLIVIRGPQTWLLDPQWVQTKLT